MTRTQLIIAEVALLLGGVLLLVLATGFPFGGDGGDGDAAPAGGDGVAAIETAEPTIEADDVEEGNDPPQDLGDCAIDTGRDFFSANEVVSFYGSPYAEALGILGALPMEELAPRLAEQGAAIDATNGFRGVKSALHIVATTAQAAPGNDGEHVLRVDHQTLQEYIDYACRERLLVFLDLQIGRGDLAAEIERIRPFLELPYVHLALDPEFKMDEGEVPGEVIGSYSAEEINQAQAALEAIVEAKGLPDKILIVHQFTEKMIERPEDIESMPHVRYTVTMDGFGEPAAKAARFRTFAQPAEYSGIKLFYVQDQPLMTEAEVAALYPDVVIYQ